MTDELVLTVENLNSWYSEGSRRPDGKSAKRQVLNDVSFKLKRGEVLGVVGESGSGKTTLAKTILGIITDFNGEITHYTKKPQMVFQDPYSSLNPAKRIGWILEEPLKNHGGYNRAERRKKAETMLERVGLSADYYNRRPQKLSGGQRQRVSIAASLMLGSELIVLDEPVSSLDVTIQAQIIRLLLDLKDEFELSYIFISHDLNVIYQMSDNVLVMYGGNIIERGTVDDIFDNPRHEYTKQLLDATMDI